MPQGLRIRLGETGAGLSGGEARRLTLVVVGATETAIQQSGLSTAPVTTGAAAALTLAAAAAIEVRADRAGHLEDVAAAGILPEDLPGLGKSAGVKVAVAQAIQARTLASSGWLAKALHLGSAANVRKLLSQAKGSGRY